MTAASSASQSGADVATSHIDATSAPARPSATTSDESSLVDESSVPQVSGAQPVPAPTTRSPHELVAELPPVYADLIQALAQTLRRGRYVARRAMCTADSRLDPSSFSLLAFVAKNPGATISDLADAQGVSKGTISRQVARLEELQFLERRPDELDLRTVRLHVSPSGRAFVNHVRNDQIAIVRDVLTDWDHADIEHFSVLLRRFADQLPTPAQDNR